MTLYGEFLKPDHRRIHKWYQYFPAYEAHFARFRNRYITIYEIGLGEGGSLQQWKAYLGPFARIVGIDIYPRCKQLEDDQVSVRIGSQVDLKFLADVVEEFGPPDIVIDDGSHLQHHVNTTFDFLYPLVAKNGVYLVEDLHAAYWPNHGGGLKHAGSFIETAKHYVDLMHTQHIGEGLTPTPLGDKTASIHFYDSVVVFEVGEHRVMGNRMTGDPALFSNAWAPPGETQESFDKVVAEALSVLEVPNDAIAAPPVPVGSPDRVRALEAEVAILRASTSWKITAPFRALGRIFK